ncbi:MAG TPA: hypothetical protein PLY87_16190 [Planctomycetaceae bacterium]|jgi:hypothetical protein|nr:hypothetical protein [Planctomycetaceae bacterium]HRA86677.1 hypothetical protein [Planctomycetaceae bacterium]
MLLRRSDHGIMLWIKINDVNGFARSDSDIATVPTDLKVQLIQPRRLMV